jgi:hypothetical protein
MSPSQLKRRIRKLSALPSVTSQLEAALAKRGTPDASVERYASQREHWLRWLEEYDGAGYYRRQNWNRKAEFVYNHINCPPMALWLGEASGVDKETVVKAKNAALHAKSSFASQSAAIRKVIPWVDIEAKLKTR